MNGVNKVTLLGAVGKDVDVKLVGENKTVARLSVATSESFKNANGEKTTNTEWHTVECWDGLAKHIGEYVKKGAMVYVEGKIKTHMYEKDGQKIYRTIIVASEIKKLKDSEGKSNDAGVAAKQAENYATPTPAGSNSSASFAEQANDDLPF